MRLSAIIITWTDTLDLLPYCINSIAPSVDDIIIVWSERSNHGVKDNRIFQFIQDNDFNYVIRQKLHWRQCEPKLRLRPKENETAKRNYGLDCARELGCTHVLMMDTDEFYKPEELAQDKIRVEQKDLNGLVCGLHVYFRKPTLWCIDTTRVATIQKLKPGLRCGDFMDYPYAFERNAAFIDPTRRYNVVNGVEWSDTICHHYSYVRKDIMLKINNSSANLRRSRKVIMRDLERAEVGYFCQSYQKNLISCDNYFNLPENW